MKKKKVVLWNTITTNLKRIRTSVMLDGMIFMVFLVDQELFLLIFWYGFERGLLCSPDNLCSITWA